MVTVTTVRLVWLPEIYMGWMQYLGMDAQDMMCIRESEKFWQKAPLTWLLVVTVTMVSEETLQNKVECKCMATWPHLPTREFHH